MTNVDPTYMKRLEDYMMFKALKTTIDTKGMMLNYVLYKKERYPLSEAICFVLYRRKIYAVLNLDPIDVRASGKPLRQIGEVYLNRKGEKDLSDMPEENHHTPYRVFRRGYGKQLFVETTERKDTCYPMLLVRTGKEG